MGKTGKKRQRHTKEAEDNLKEETNVDPQELKEETDADPDPEETVALEESEAEDKDDDSDAEDNKDSDVEDSEAAPKKRKRKIRKLDLTEVENFNEKLKKRGVVYIARIPPTMGPSKVKSLMSDFGEVTRVYLREEDKTARKRRKWAGANGGKRYIEGWVEFSKRWVAKRAGTMLNNSPISMEKRNRFYGELWNVKFVRKLEWSHLTEKSACERRLREQKLMKELLYAKKENSSYVIRVEEGNKRDMIDEKRRKQAEKRGEAPPEPSSREFYIRQQDTFEDRKKEGNKTMLGALF
jgi:ESF2/ABP1 family protein